MPVNTKHLRDLMQSVIRIERLELSTGEAVDQVTHAVEDVVLDVETSRIATDLRMALHRAIRTDLLSLLDEIDTSRALLREGERVLVGGTVRQRSDLQRRIAAFLEKS